MSLVEIMKIPFKNAIKKYSNLKSLIHFLRKHPKEKLTSILGLIKDEIKTFIMQPTYRNLERIKKYQKENYELIKSRFIEYYNQINRYDIHNFTKPAWDEYNSKIEPSLLPYPRFAFLNEPVIKSTMFIPSHVKWIKDELKFIKGQFSKKKLQKYLLEDYIGMPYLNNVRYLTSNNTIHHFYSISRFLEKTKCDLNKMNTIIEWGGGYGNMAKLILRMINKKITYILIDTPLFSCVQWLYLSCIFGSKNINLMQNSNDNIKPQKINIIPVNFVENYMLNGDLFISTWVLSESSRYSQDFVLNSDWFNSKHILLAYQESNDRFIDANRIESYYKKYDLKIEPIPFLPGNNYAMK